MQPETSSAGNLDPQAKAMAMAIRQTESGGNFSAKGKSGEYGAYQFTEPTWNSYASKYGITAKLSEATPEQQNEVAYKKIKEWKDAGLNPGQIASSWNAGEAEKDAYTGTFSNGKPSVGTNKYGVKFDVPTYAKSVATAYQTLKQGGQVQPDQNNPSSVQTRGYATQPTFTEPQTGQGEQPKQDASLLQDVSGVATKRLEEAATAATQAAQGKINPLSGVLQVGGALAGGASDIVSKGLEHTPVVGAAVKGIEGLIGQGVGALASTDTGQSVIKSVMDWSKDHPELAGDVGAGFNIMTAIPIFKGLGAIKNVVLDASSQALKSVAEKSITNDLTSAVSKTIGGRNMLKNSPNAIKTLIEERAIPEITADSKYTTKEASEQLSHTLDQKETELENVLKSQNVQGAKPVVNIEQARNTALKAATEELEGQGNYKTVLNKINEFFDTASNSGKAVSVGGEKYLKLEDANFFKRQARKGLSFDDTVGKNAGFHVGQSYMKSIEDIATKNGLGDVHRVNQEMGKLIQAQKLLGQIEGKNVKLGSIGGTIKNLATAGGEVAGQTTGIPVAGAFLGRQAGGFVGKKIAGIGEGILKRTGKNAVTQSAGTLAKKTSGMIGTIGTRNSKK